MIRAGDDISISVTDLRRHIHRVLRDVERGTTFTIVRRGQPGARLVPAGVAG